MLVRMKDSACWVWCLLASVREIQFNRLMRQCVCVCVRDVFDL